MRWTPGGMGDIIDRRGGGGRGFGGGPAIGCGGAIILLILSLLTGKNFFSMVDGGSGAGTTQQAPVGPDGQQPPVSQTPEEEKTFQFVGFLAKDTQDTWTQIFQREGGTYRRSKVVTFRDATESGCGVGQKSSGPFYCPADEMVYIDMSFYDELHRRFGAPGDFAQAYVIAHEIGHHVQNITGVAPKVREAMERDRRNANEYSVRLELQADCFAGIWAHSTQERKLLEEGDVDEALNAAAAIGDDRMQKEAGRRVSPESFTHGTSAQRQEWFRRGLQSGRVADCDTFADMR